MKRKDFAKKIPVGYKDKKYSWGKSIGHFRKVGTFKIRKDGSGHRAGEKWGDEKGIDPDEQQRRYSKNSPSFDEGVWLSKQKRGGRLKMAMKLTEPITKLGVTK